MDLTTLALLFLSLTLIIGFGALFFMLKNTSSNDALQRLAGFLEMQNNQLVNQERTLQETLYKSISGIGERLALIDKAQNTMSELSTNVMGLQEILGNRQARGAFGEVQLQDIITSLLPPSSYSFQETIDGKRVDCLLQLPNPPGPIAVDAKFPLEGYRAMQSATNEFDAKNAARAFKAHVMKHIQDIAEKYIIPGKTADSAIMFLPSEAIYAELHSNFLDVIDASYKARVWIVCPTTFMATLHTLRAILKDVQMREQTGKIREHVLTLLKDMERLDERCAKLESHFSQTQEDVRLVRITSQKLMNRASMIERAEFDDDLKETHYGT